MLTQTNGVDSPVSKSYVPSVAVEEAGGLSSGPLAAPAAAAGVAPAPATLKIPAPAAAAARAAGATSPTANHIRWMTAPETARADSRTAAARSLADSRTDGRTHRSLRVRRSSRYRVGYPVYPRAGWRRAHHSLLL